MTLGAEPCREQSEHIRARPSVEYVRVLAAGLRAPSSAGAGSRPSLPSRSVLVDTF